MLFDNGHIGYHMMDWNISHWFFFLLGIGILILIGVIVAYYILTNYNNKYANSGRDSQTTTLYKKESDAENNMLEKPLYCYSCGEKFDNRSVKFCPYCSTEI
ncbi:MAG: hypothetical protein ACFFE4_05055 [Candidatus Thorarchaeota archaeon]